MNQAQIEEPFATFLEFVEEADRVLQVSIQAISNISGIGRLAEVLYRSKEIQDKEDRIKAAKTLEKLAAKEKEDGFPLLIAHSVVGIWAALEATVPRFLSRWLSAHPILLSSEKIQRIKLSVSAFSAAGQEEFSLQVIDELSRSTQSGLKAGIGRFESLLDCLELGGSVDDKLRRDIYELSKVRNLIVHQFSRVDTKFARDCPWMQIEIGARLKLTLQDYARYRSAICEYGAQLIERSRKSVHSQNIDGNESLATKYPTPPRTPPSR